MKWIFRLSDLELVQGQRDVGQQVLHHRLVLWGVSSWVCRSVPVSQQTGAQVSHWMISHCYMDSLRWDLVEILMPRNLCVWQYFRAWRGGCRGGGVCELADHGACRPAGTGVLHTWEQELETGEIYMCAYPEIITVLLDYLLFLTLSWHLCHRHTCRPGLWFCGFCWRLEKGWLVWRSARGQMDDQMLS